MAQIGSSVLNVTDIDRAATFWRNALGYVPRGGDNPGALVPQRGEGPALLLDETDRTHLDLQVAGERNSRPKSGGSFPSVLGAWIGSIPIAPIS